MPLAACVGATLAAWLLLRVFPGDRDAKGAVLALLVVGIFGYGHAKRALQSVWPVETGYVLAAAVVVLAGGVALVIVKRHWAFGLTPGINVFASCLMAMAAAQIFLPGSGRAPWSPPPRPAPEAGSSGHRHPNIFYVVVDGYARDDLLREVLGFDNRAFLDYLTERGFVVAASSRSNYGQTDRSIASSLNMRLLRPDDPAPAVLIEHNEVFSVLRHHGYRCLAFASGYRTTEIEGADDILGTQDQGWSELEKVLFAMTPAPDAIRLLRLPNPFRVFDEDAQRARILYTLAQLPEAAADPGPVFVFAHILAPHPPYVFGPQGQRRERDEYVGLGDEAGWHPRHKEDYVGQLTFLNAQLRMALDGILARSSEPPIVILQADHGSAFRLTAQGPEATGALAERFSVFNAILGPPEVKARWYAGITPVNTFRILFGAVFGTGDRPLTDRSFWSFDGKTDRDVTAMIN
jgi:hypothetical protein